MVVDIHRVFANLWTTFLRPELQTVGGAATVMSMTKQQMKQYEAANTQIDEDWFSGQIATQAELVERKEALKTKFGGQKAIDAQIMKEHLADAQRRAKRQARDQAKFGI